MKRVDDGHKKQWTDIKEEEELGKYKLIRLTTVLNKSLNHSGENNNN